MYEDIIDLPHHVSAHRSRLSAADRAAQFSPFAALTGFHEEIAETGRLTDEPPAQDDEARAELEQKLLAALVQTQPAVTVVYFVPDERKQGGRYETVTGTLRSIDAQQRRLLLKDGTELALDDIVDVRPG